MAQEIECLFCRNEALSSNSSPTQIKASYTNEWTEEHPAKSWQGTIEKAYSQEALGVLGVPPLLEAPVGPGTRKTSREKVNNPWWQQVMLDGKGKRILPVCLNFPIARASLEHLCYPKGKRQHSDCKVNLIVVLPHLDHGLLVFKYQ
jgi:hypothetical protein